MLIKMSVWEGFCFRCRQSVLFEPVRETVLDGRRLNLAGRCPHCGGQVRRIVSISPQHDRGLPVRIDSDIATAIRIIAQRRGITQRQVVREMFETYMQDNPELIGDINRARTLRSIGELFNRLLG